MFLKQRAHSLLSTLLSPCLIHASQDTGIPAIVKTYIKQGITVKQRARIQREIEIMCAVSGGHPNIATLYAVYEDDEGIKLVMSPFQVRTSAIRPSGMLAVFHVFFLPDPHI